MTLQTLPKYATYKDSGIEWLGEIPAHWGFKALKHIASLRSGETIKPDDFSEDGYPVYGGNGFRGYTPTYTNDGSYILIGRQGALCGNVNYASGKFYASEHAIVVYPKSKIETLWLGETIRVADFNRFSQSAAQPGIAVAIIKDVYLPFPPLEEQTAIAHFLDQKTAQIDAAIAIKEQQIALLKERKQILIQQAVTQGLDPTVPMKDSGVEWIGEIPAHWEVGRSRWLFNQRRERARYTDEQLTASQKYGVISQKEFMEIEGRKVTQVEFNSEILKHVESNDFVISMRSFQGGIEYCPFTGCVSSAYVPLIPRDQVYSPYYKYLLKSKRYIEALQSTSNLVRDGQALRYDNFWLFGNSRGSHNM
jgi:type I restriction enzyme S subunit